MNDLLRCLSAERLKIKRTLALRLAFIAPVIIVILVFAGTAQRGSAPAAGVNPLLGYAQLNLTLWTITVLPLYASLLAALLAALEHSGNNWKLLLTLPVRAEQAFVAKWVIGAGLLAISTGTLVGGIVLGCECLRAGKTSWHDAAIPAEIVGLRGVQIWGAAILLWSVHFWVSMRWRNFIVGLVVAVAAVMVMLAGVQKASNAPWLVQFFPWSLPAMAMARMTEQMPERAFATWWGALGGIGFGLLAIRSLARLEN